MPTIPMLTYFCVVAEFCGHGPFLMPAKFCNNTMSFFKRLLCRPREIAYIENAKRLMHVPGTNQTKMRRRASAIPSPTLQFEVFARCPRAPANGVKLQEIHTNTQEKNQPHTAAGLMREKRGSDAVLLEIDIYGHSYQSIILMGK
jgi:hypothetical protein